MDLDDATLVAREAGIDLVANRRDVWEDPETLAQEGPKAFKEPEVVTAPEEQLLPRNPGVLYLREISHHRLLTHEEEIALARQIEAGKVAKEKLASGVADPAEREALEEALRAGATARQRMIESNLRLVVSIARKYIGSGLPFLDLVQEGNIGLQRGVDRYDWRKGFRFSTYAYWWIRQAVSRGVAGQARTIRLPAHISEQLPRLYNTVRAVEDELGRPPTPAEIGERLGMEPERVREVFQAVTFPISLETPIGNQEGSVLADVIPDAASRGPAEAAEEEVLRRMMDRALEEHLTPREAHVLRLRFGLDRGSQERTLEEVGRDLGMSRERVRQIEAEAIEKLRTAVPFQLKFKEYIE